jgi:Tfp pilus assembly protein PilF
MKKIMLVYCVLALSLPDISAAGPRPKNNFERISLLALDGKKVEFANYRARVTVVQLWATWCQPCILELPFVEALFQYYKKDRQISVLSVNVDFSDAKDSLPLIKNQVRNLEMPVLVDQEMSLARCLSPGRGNPGKKKSRSKPVAVSKAPPEMQLPLLVVIDAKGKMYRFLGFESGISKKTYIKRKSKIIELARAGKLPSQKEKSLNRVVPQAIVLAQIGRPRQAEEILKLALSKDKNNASILFALGNVYRQMGKADRSIAMMRRILKSDPDNAKAMSFIGYALVEQGKNLKEAERLIRKALSIEPENGFFIDSLGWLFYKQGLYEQARKELEKAVQLVPNDWDMLVHLAETYLKLGSCEKAVQQYRKAVKAAGNKKISIQIPGR